MSIQGYEWFNLGMNKSVPGVKPTAVGMKGHSQGMKKTSKRYEIE
jgi:hypothetical protein